MSRARFTTRYANRSTIGESGRPTVLSRRSSSWTTLLREGAIVCIESSYQCFQVDRAGGGCPLEIAGETSASSWGARRDPPNTKNGRMQGKSRCANRKVALRTIISQSQKKQRGVMNYCPYPAIAKHAIGEEDLPVSKPGVSSQGFRLPRKSPGC